MDEFIHRVGPLFYPLLACSIVGMAIILERSVILCRWQRISATVVRDLVVAAGDPTGRALRHKVLPIGGALRDGTLQLLDCPLPHKQGRDEAAAVWLQEVGRGLTRRLDLLRLIASLSPMLGLLGTVIGMVSAFQEIAGQQGPIGPALLADGLWQAMLTTAIGLVIALPATLMASILGGLAENRVADLSVALNRISLAMEAASANTDAAGMLNPDDATAHDQSALITEDEAA